MSGKPKYIQIEDSILNQIKGGDLRPGDQIPTEAELCDTFKVSRMTVNKAIQSLASKGYINRVAGKGSFVTNVHIQKPIVRIPQSFSEDMRSIGLTPVPGWWITGYTGKRTARSRCPGPERGQGRHGALFLPHPYRQ